MNYYLLPPELLELEDEELEERGALELEELLLLEELTDGEELLLLDDELGLALEELLVLAGVACLVSVLAGVACLASGFAGVDFLSVTA